VGKWLSSLTALTGSADRPGDTLDAAELWVHQWVKDSASQSFMATWRHVASFEAGSASITAGLLEEGPVVSVRSRCFVARRSG